MLGLLQMILWYSSFLDEVTFIKVKWVISWFIVNLNLHMVTLFWDDVRPLSCCIACYCLCGLLWAFPGDALVITSLDLVGLVSPLFFAGLLCFGVNLCFGCFVVRVDFDGLMALPTSLA